MTNSQAEHDNLAVLRKMSEAFNRKQLDEVMALFTDDSTYEDYKGSAPAGDRYVGSSAIRSAFARMFDEGPDTRFEDILPIVSERWAALEYTVILPHTPELRCKVCDFFEFRNGKVARKSTWIKQLRLP